MLGRIIFPILFVMAAIVAVFGVLIFTPDPAAEMVTAEAESGAMSPTFPARAIGAFQNIAAVFTQGNVAELATVMVDDMAALDALANGVTPEEEPVAEVPSTPFVRRAGAADVTAAGAMTCAIENGVRRCRVGN